MSALRTVLVLLLLALCALPASAGGPDPMEAQFASAYASDDAGARAKAIDLLLKAPDPVKFQCLWQRVVGKEKRADVLSHAVDVLRTIKDDKVIEGVVNGARAGPLSARVIYVEVLGVMNVTTTTHATLLELVKDKETYIRSLAAAGLGNHRTIDALEPLMKLLEDKAWSVQAAAVSSISRLRDIKTMTQTVVPKLVLFMEDTTGRLRAECGEALKRITGKNLGREPKAWRNWLNNGMKDAPGDAAADKPKVPDNGYAQQEEKPQFYGMEVVTNRVVIVLDKSLTMYEPIQIDRDRLRRETSRRKVITGEKSKPDEPEDEDHGYDIPWWKIKTRLDLARYQTINLVAQLKEDQFFEIIVFSGEIDQWMGHLVPASQVNKQKAITMLEELKCDARTNLWGAIAAAFEMVDVNRKDAAMGPDEMYLVTDGAPSECGDITDANQILEATLQLHKLKPMKINVIQVGYELDYLRKMARETGGQARFFKSPGAETAPKDKED